MVIVRTAAGRAQPFRLLLLIHRYLGIAGCVFMLAWCLSGFVMMQVSYPSLAESARVAALRPLSAAGCCAQPADEAADMAVASAQFEMRAGRLVADVGGADGSRRVVDLASGRTLPAATLGEARTTAAEFGAHAGIASADLQVAPIDRDQWTVAGNFNADRPLWHVRFADAAGSELYVSSASGKAVQFTTSRLRFWNWLGAVPHWIYFAPLRRHPAMWTNVIIVASLVGVVLVATGLWIGCRQWLRRPASRVSPYRGYLLWHHVPGLVFGVFLLTWVASGLLSMNPWGLLEGGDAGPERAALAGAPPRWSEARAAIARVLQRPDIGSFVSVRSVSFDGRLHFVATTTQGARVRLAGDGQDAPLTAADWDRAGRLLGGAAAPERLDTEDAYWFSHHGDPVSLPVHRLALDDAKRTRYYLDPVSGEILRKVDAGARGYRWWHQALHRLDFLPALRTRPVWDVLMVVLLGGATLVSATGLQAAALRLGGRRRRRPARDRQT